MILAFCAIYPILMGLVQAIMDTIAEKIELKLNLVAELYSLFYAALPYKLVYLDIEDLELGFLVLGVKFVYKMIVYLIIPCCKKKKLRLKVSQEHMEARNRKLITKTSPMTPMTNTNKNITSIKNLMPLTGASNLKISKNQPSQAGAPQDKE